jgi:K+-sensing histidine kinase KdpD
LLIIFIYSLYRISRKYGHSIQEQNSALHEADEFKNKLISILAHDFRTPLISTISIAGMMRDNQDLTETELEQFYADIEKDATQILESFDVILQWIKQQLSGYQFKAETLTLHGLFNETGHLFHQQLEEKNVTFSNKVPGHLVAVTDKEMLQFVNRNLLSNAIRFSPQGGTITINATQYRAAITVTVADEGPGFSAGTISQLFSVSGQFGSSTQHGAGIALAMCKDFIGKLGGSIGAENKKPNGALFYYTIPISRPE